MRGFAVITSDAKRAGHVVDEQGDYLIVERGTLRKRRHALPRAFAHSDDSERVVRATVPSELLRDAPEIGDHDAIARHYGLAETEPDPPVRSGG
jgi:hypothetical protein